MDAPTFEEGALARVHTSSLRWGASRHASTFANSLPMIWMIVIDL
jgi:hypothetical protein